jgi:hypothetical protein
MTKTTIIIGAGAGKDFCVRQKTQDEKVPEINMPTGEELVKQMIGFKDKILEYFLYDFLKEKLTTMISSNRPEVIINYAYDIYKKLYSFYIQDNDNKSEINLRELFDGNYDYYNLKIHLQRIGILTPNNFTNEIIEKDSKSKEELTHLILKTFSTLKNYYNLSKLLEEYDPPSIDNFLSQITQSKIDIKSTIEGFKDSDTERKELAKAGKELIAFYLLKSEDQNIFNANNKIWYRWLRNAIMNAGNNQEAIENHIKENLTIISFNYDRSLDYYLSKRLTTVLYEAIKAKIIYPYGALCDDLSYEEFDYGFLKKKFDSNGKMIPSQENADSIANLFLKEDSPLKQFADKIEIIGRDKDVTKEKFKRASQKIKESNKLYFLGFGFLRENCEELKLNNPRAKTKGTFYTNFDDSLKIKNIFEETFYLHKVKEIISQTSTSSPRGVYDALEKDFDLDIGTGSQQN